ncbi:hypothetical protein J3E71DRAFT_187005 [Bipolaris maydis]|nr:hypothetical protein J3E71DRAFT_187005 [Bipolaris maydis]
MHDKTEQEQLIEEDGNSGELRIQEKQLTTFNILRLSPYKVIMLTMWSLCLVFWTLMLLTTLKSARPASRTLHCGNSTAEAKSLECVYDTLSGNWVPEPCFDEETLHEFEEAGPWPRWRDREGTKTLSSEEIAEYALPGPSFYGTPVEHAAHCVYDFKRMIKLRDQWGRVPPSSTSEWHMNHCVGLLMAFITATNGTPEPVTYTRYSQYAGFSTCVIDD